MAVSPTAAGIAVSTIGGRRHRALARVSGLTTMVGTAAGVIVAILATTASTVRAQTPEPVPCEVAMVVGCVTTVPGTDQPIPVTLRMAGATAGTDSAADPDPAAPPTPATATAATTPEPAPTDPPDADGSERPVQSGVDPWERGGLRTNFGTGSIPISHYQIGADTSGFLGVPDPLDSFVASQTNWAFTTATFLVLLATNALDWAFEFPLAQELVGEAGVLAQSYTVDFFGFGLSTSVYGLALTVTMIVAGFKAVTKGLIAAGSEVLLAFAAYVVLIVLTLTSAFGDAGLQVARLSSDLSGSIASFAAGEERQAECAAALAAGRDPAPLAGAEAATPGSIDGPVGPPAAGSSACSFGFSLQRSLVELPYQNLQWGQVLDGVEGKEACAEINQELLSEGPWGNADEPRDRMGAVEACKENADFNQQATYIRLGIASANTVASAIVTLLVLVVAAMLLWQQLKLLFLTAVMPHALVFAILPGRSRALAWQWIEHLLGVVIRTVILSLGLVVWLSLFSLIVYEQLTFRGIFLSLFASTAMAVAGFYGLYRLSGITGRINPATTGAGVGRRTRNDGPQDAEGRDGGQRRTMVRVAGSALRTVRTRRPNGPAGGPIPAGPSGAGGRTPVRHNGDGPLDRAPGLGGGDGLSARPDGPGDEGRVPVGAGRS